MFRTLFIAAIFAAFAASPAHAATFRVVYATVGAGGAVNLTTPKGHQVRKLGAGTYRIVVRDRSRTHNFRMSGPVNAANRATGVGFVGTQRWTLQLSPGIYTYGSDARTRAQWRRFRVT